MRSRQRARFSDRLMAAAALLILSPVLTISALAIRFTTRGPILYRATRVGLSGRFFTMYKLRTMRIDSQQPGGAVTAGADPRVFPVGRLLRRAKVDETLQFINIVCGEMALVGPRPEDPRIVQDHYTERMRESLTVLPGLTSPGTLEYLANEQLIQVGSEGEQFYIEELLPRKLALDLVYIRRRSLSYDLKILYRTAVAIACSKRRLNMASTTEAKEAATIEAEIRREQKQQAAIASAKER